LETRIGVRAAVVDIEEYFVNVISRNELHHAVRSQVETESEGAVVATWLMDAQLLANRLRASEPYRDDAREMIADGHQLEVRVIEESAKWIRECVEEVAEALHDD